MAPDAASAGPPADGRLVERGNGHDRATGSSFSSSGLNFENSRSQVLEKQLRENGLMAKHPLMFLPLFGDPDPETVLTGAAGYTLAQFYGDVKPQDLDKASRTRSRGGSGKAPDASRRPGPSGRDRHPRRHQMDDAAGHRQGLDDQTNEIRITTVSWVNMVRAKWSWESDPDNKEEPELRPPGSPGTSSASARRTWRRSF